MIAAYAQLNSADGLGSRRSLSFRNSLHNFRTNPYEPSLAEIEACAPNYIDSISLYKDAAIVVLGRPGSESSDFSPGTVDPGLGNSDPLELTANERDVIGIAKNYAKKVIVLLNTATPVETKELEEDEEIDAILWIGYCGNYGTLGIADVISGRENPSGALPDIYAASALSHPASMNVGAFEFANYAGNSFRSRSRYYIIESEGIYVGYRYYETRYFDSVYRRNDADSATGAVASAAGWRYDEEVVYPFGFGLSYTTFSQQLVGTPSFRKESHGFIMDITVGVTNTGTVAGKSIVEIYGQAPWSVGKVEKSAIQLLGYDKTGLLMPGETENVTIRADLQNIASYDASYNNSDGTKGCWILDEGDYYFAFGNGSHEALNNILAAQGKTAADGMDGAGDLTKAYKYTYRTFTGTQDDETFGITKTGRHVSNHIEYSDWNYYEPNKITHLTRQNFGSSYPVTQGGLSAPATMFQHLKGEYYSIKTDEEASDIVFGKDNGLKFYEFAFLDYDDANWQMLLEQITLTEAMGIMASCGDRFRSIHSVGFEEGSYTENSGNGISLNLAACRVEGCPWQCKEKDANASYRMELFACAPMVAASFNPDLQFELGEMIGLQALIVQLPILWGPGLNTHRHPYNGRNCDYYSEDPVLAGRTAEEFVIGALKYGLVAAAKHFAFNDQETQRNGIAPFLNEQRAREIELRAFQIAIESKKYNTTSPAYWTGEQSHHFGMLGMMTSLSKIGAVECTCSRGLLTDIVRGEWGFNGYIVSDISDDTDLFSALVYAGMTGYDVRRGFRPSGFDMFQSMNDGIVPSEELYACDRELLIQFKEIAHSLLFTFCQSNLINIYNSSTHKIYPLTWWRWAYIISIVLSGALLILSVTMYLFLRFKKSKNGNI